MNVNSEKLLIVTGRKLKLLRCGASEDPCFISWAEKMINAHIKYIIREK